MLSLKSNTILNFWKPIPREGQVTALAPSRQGISPSDPPGTAYIRPKGGLTTHNLLAGYSPANGQHSKKPHLEDRGKGNRIPCGHQHRQVLYCH